MVISTPEVRTIVTVLDERVKDRPEKIFLRFRDVDLTYAEFDRRSRSLAAGLRRHGVAGVGSDSGSTKILPTLLPNSADAVALWFALNRVGAVWAPLNTEFRGRGLAHAINITGSRDLVVDETLLGPVVEIGEQLEHLERLFVRRASDQRATEPAIEHLEVQPLEVLALEDEGAEPTPPRTAADTSLLIYTSGTTGVSKACQLSHYYVIGNGSVFGRSLGMHEDDVAFCPYPLFHLDATVCTVVPALLLGATAVITERFSVSKFWDDVRHFGATMFDFMGATLTWLYKREPEPDDANNPARLGWGVPMPAFKTDIEERFGVTLVEGYGSTEGGLMVHEELGKPSPERSCGRCIAEYQLRIVDVDDDPLGPGEIGEIIVRPTDDEDRHLMMTGYYRMSEMNEEVFRGGWFHTGDLGRLDEDGNLFFEGRKTDAIRRRGENISPFEIQQVIESHPAVLEVAAYGVPSEFTEEDVAVAVVLKKEHELSNDDLLEFCRDRMARYMVPSCVRFLDALPKTPTEKVAKRVLKEWHE